MKPVSAQSALAIYGGDPVRQTMLPYGRQWLDEGDIAAVVNVLRSDWLTTGPNIAEFERKFASFTCAEEAVAVCNGTAALHAAVHAAGIGPGDEVLVPPLTFVATANCVVFAGGTPVFVDVDPDTLLIDPVQVEQAITERTKALMVVDFAGQPCDYEVLGAIAEKHGLALIVDACHSVGGEYRGQAVGSLGDFSAFSFHPVKGMTTGEGGMVTTNNAEWANRMRIFRSHGISADHRQRAQAGAYFYEMVELGYNYRITDLQCALGMSQLRKLPAYIRRRREVAARYDAALAKFVFVKPLAVCPEIIHAYHLYVVRFDTGLLEMDREQIFSALRAENIGVNVHYIPVHLHPFYRDRFATGPGLCPVAEAAYEEIITLPLFASMTDEDIDDVIEAIGKLAR